MKAQAFIYWNFHKKVYSVKYRGRVIAHATRFLAKRAEFKVSEAGRQKVLAEKCKNVHAGIVCDLDDLYCDSLRLECERSDPRLTWPNEVNVLATNATEYGAQIRYNPYEAGHFMIAGNHQAVKSAAIVYGTRNLLYNRAALWAERFA